MHIIYMHDIIAVDFDKHDDVAYNAVKVIARVHLGLQKGYTRVVARVYRSSVHVSCAAEHRDLEPRITLADNVLLAARLFGKLL